MKQLLTLLIALTGAIAGIAQVKNGKISGHVIDGNAKTIESATIALLKASDSTVVKYSVANRDGKFVFENIPSGTYLVSITAVGHQKGFSSKTVINETNPEVALPTIELIPQAKTMGEVVITARKPLIEQKIDRTVVNVDASVTNVGSTAMEVLEKSPGISVDREGNVSLKGKQGVMILIDGRPTQLGGADLANLLRSMSASNLDQIEIMTNPPAKYDAAGNAGIINIKTKKNRQFGYNGSVNVNYGQGLLPKFNEGLNFNYRQGKWNLFTNFSHTYRERSNKLDIKRNFLDENTKAVVSHFDQEARMKSEGSYINAKLGADYFAGKNTTVGIVFSGFSNNSDFTNNNLTNIYNNNMSLQNKTSAHSFQNEKWKNFSTNLNFRQVLDTTGKELTADLDYITYDAASSQVLSNYYFDAVGNISQKGDTLYGFLPQVINIYGGRMDYLMPLKKGARFEAGIKTSIVKTDNHAGYDIMDYGMIESDLLRTNDFDYEENINAAYVNLSTPLGKKISAQFGLRLENTVSKGFSNGYTMEQSTGNIIPSDTSFTRKYTQLFPTAYFQYKASENHNFGLNYGRRIRRPNYESLNPFREYLDRYTYQEGNPNLKPQFSHNIELSHSYKGHLNTTINYTRTNDIIQQVLEQNESTNETFVKQANIANQRQYGIAVSANMPMNKWWTNSIYVNVFNNRFEGLINNTPVTIEQTTLMLNGSQQFKLGKTTTAEISGWFRTAGIEGVFQARAMGGLNIGFSQQVMQGKGSIRLNVRDILWTQGFKAISKYGTVDAEIKERGDSRVVNIGLSYRFNKGKMNGGPKRRNSSANDEQNRVGVGN